MASILAGRENRPKFGSKKGNPDRGSITNKEKNKKKAFKMIAHKRDVVRKTKMSLRDKQRHLRKHVQKQKMRKK